MRKLNPSPMEKLSINSSRETLTVPILEIGNGILTDSFSHKEGCAEILIEKAGVYEIHFQISGLHRNKFSIIINNNPIPHTTFISPEGYPPP